MTLNKLPLVFFAATFVPLAVAQSLGQGVVSGTVVDAESGDPIRKAIVTLTLQSAPRRWATARTDGSGHFQFDGLPPGKYELRAAKGSEGSANYGANHFHELGDLLSLADGEIRAVTLRFLRAGFISGHVYDSDGDPVTGAAVNLMRKGWNLGAPILMNYRGATTDDHGEYRIPNIDPGQYYLHATPELNRQMPDPSFQRKSILVDEYYGGERDSRNATALHVSGGEQLAGLDFRLPSEPVAQVHGRVAGVPAPAEAAASETVRPAVQAAFRSGRVDNGGIHVMISP
ncbi:MAG TPA: carboxypeptidase-like regulatory domain-containing protein, partial [Bryobacteraceae bacterium]